MDDAIFPPDKWTIRQITLTALIFIFVGRIQELIPGGTMYNLGKIVVGLALVLYLFSSPKTKSTVRLGAIPQFWIIMALVILSFLSIPFSVWPGESFSYFFSGYLKVLIFFFLLIKMTSSLENLRQISLGFFAAVVVLAAVTVFTSEETRAAASDTYDPNDIALVMVLSIPISYYLIKVSSKIKKIILLCGLGLMVVTIIKTQSRGGFLGLLGIVLFILYRETRKNFILMVGILLTGSILFYVLTSESYRERLKTILMPSSDYNLTVKEGRVEIWKRGLSLMLENPVLGIGIGAFTTAEGLSHKDAGGKWSAAHNSFIQIGTELGVFGLILFISLLVKSIRRLRQYRKKFLLHPEGNDLILNLINGLEISLWGYCIAGFFLSQAYTAALYFLLANGLIIERLQLTIPNNNPSVQPSAAWERI